MMPKTLIHNQSVFKNYGATAENHRTQNINSQLFKTPFFNWQQNEKGNTLNVVKISTSENEFIRLNNNFKKSLETKEEVFKCIPKNFVFERFNYLVNQFISMDYDAIQTGATDDLSIYVRASFGESTAFVEIFFDDENINSTENILNIIENKDFKISKSGELEFLFETLNQELVSHLFD